MAAACIALGVATRNRLMLMRRACQAQCKSWLEGLLGLAAFLLSCERSVILVRKDPGADPHLGIVMLLIAGLLCICIGTES